MGSEDQKQRHRVSEMEADEGVPADGKAGQLSRRRALIAGLVAAPTVLSLMNRSAWGGQTFVSCTLVASYVNAGNRWQSPRPSNANGTLAIGPQDINNCRPK